MEDLHRELVNHLKSGAAISISQYLRQFEENELLKDPTRESLVFHLFACYITGNLAHARLLWKRTPKGLKSAGEIEKTWEIGRYLLKHSIPSALKHINSFHWTLSEPLIPMLKKKLIEDLKKIIQNSYISLELSKFAEFLAVNQSEANDYLNKWGWNVESGFVFPSAAVERKPRQIEDEDIVAITEMVNYLEQKMHIGIE